MSDPDIPRSVPVPDPTRLTTDAVEKATDQWRRELESTQRLLEAKITENGTRIRGTEDSQKIFARERADQIHAVRELIETRLAGMDLATQLVASSVRELPVEMRAQLDRDMVAARTDIHSLRELLGARIDGMDVATKLLADNVSGIAEEIEKSAAGLKEIIETRLAGMDEATKLLAVNVDKVPYAILQEAGNLKSLILSRIEEVSHVSDEKFAAVESTFASNALALTAALAAQKEAAAEQNKSNTLAITKSEAATKETVAANATQAASSRDSLAKELADLKERLVRLESGGVATAVARTEQRADRTYGQAERYGGAAGIRATVSAAIAALAVILSAVFGILLAIKH